MAIEKQLLWYLAYACIGRRDDYALQQFDGRYRRVGRPVGYEALRLHLAGEQTIGTYVTDEKGMCHFAVFDADSDAGLYQLLEVQQSLAGVGIRSYLELSRRGGHLWVFLSRLLPVDQLRRWLLPFCPPGVEFYPKRDWVTCDEPGSLIRVPFGVHLRSGRRYPFVGQDVSGRLVPVASTLEDSLAWLSTVERACPPAGLERSEQPERPNPSTHTHSLQKNVEDVSPPAPRTIRDWCLAHDPLAVIGRYVSLDRRGMGRCPFGWHHAGGKDAQPSLWVHRPKAPDLACWYCNVWKQGGSLFDFLSLYHDLDARVLWRRIQGGEQF